MKIITLILQLLGVAGGVFIGLSMKSAAPADRAADAHAVEDAHEKKGDKKHKKDKKGKKDSHGTGGEESAYGFLKFSRQFIVPVVEGNSVQSLVVFEINLEIDPASTETAYSQEPKLRDALLSALFSLSNEGAFDGHLLDEENLQHIRSSLLAAARAVIGQDVMEVLILNIARQDM